MPIEYVSLKDVASAFHVSPNTVRRWLSEGTIPGDAYIQQGKVYRFSLEKVEAALLSKEGGIQQEFDFGEETDPRSFYRRK